RRDRSGPARGQCAVQPGADLARCGGCIAAPDRADRGRGPQAGPGSEPAQTERPDPGRDLHLRGSIGGPGGRPADLTTPNAGRTNAGCTNAGCEACRKSTRLNSSHVKTSYAVFCLKKKKKKKKILFNTLYTTEIIRRS